MPPAKAIERLRLESARAAIEAGEASIDRIARDNGFQEPDRMRRVFIRIYGEPPQAIRRKAANGAAPVAERL